TRTLDSEGQIMWGLTLEQGTTWSYHEYLKPWLEGKNRDWIEVIRGTSWDNPFHDPAVLNREYERLKSIDPIKADVRYKGAWLDLTGTPFFSAKGMADMGAYANKREPKYAEFVEAN